MTVQSTFSATDCSLEKTLTDSKPVVRDEVLSLALKYDFHELMSALQKDIRRGNEYQAMYWATLIERINPKALWNRLRIMASEDVGIANPLAPVVIDVLHREYIKFYDPKKPKKDSFRLFSTNAVLFLAKCPKSRIVDDLLITVNGNIKFKHEELVLPDYAIDKHTFQGRKMGRGFKFFVEEGTYLSNETIDNLYKETAAKILLTYGKP